MKPKQEYSDSVSLDFWIKHRNKIYGIILLIVGALGGNVDRVTSLIPTDPTIYTRLDALETKVDILEKSLIVDGGVSMDDNFSDSSIRIKNE